MIAVAARLLLALITCGLLVGCDDTGFEGKRAASQAQPNPIGYDASQAGDGTSTDEAKKDDAAPATDDGGRAKSLAPAEAISAGSFSVWTVPKDPVPYQDYTVFIEIRLPKKTKSYDAGDLAGSVQGTDGYLYPFTQLKQDVDSKAVGYSLKEGRVELQISVPGAVQAVRDTIVIRSRMLDEKQTLKLTF